MKRIVVIQLLMLVLFSFCSENAKEKNPLTTKSENTSVTESGLREISELEKTTNTLSFDTSQYPIHLRDNFNDYTYLKPITRDSSNFYNTDYYGYEGYLVHQGEEYESSLIYYSPSKQFSATLGYKYDSYMNYNCTLAGANYFVGTYCFGKMYSNKYNNKLSSIKCTILKGSFPGMNN